MKTHFFALILSAAGFSLFAQTTQLVPGVQDRVESLLNKPAMIQDATATPLGKNWFRLETDAHILSDEVSVAQVSSVLLDLENQDAVYNGIKSKLTAKVISVGADEAVVDFVSISMAPLGIQIKTPYRATVRAITNTNDKIALEVKQLQEDSASNKDIKNLFATRYAEAVTINGKPYTYIRIYTIDEVNASILPGAKGTLEKNSAPVNEETLQLLIAAAKTR